MTISNELSKLAIRILKISLRSTGAGQSIPSQGSAYSTLAQYFFSNGSSSSCPVLDR